MRKEHLKQHLVKYLDRRFPPRGMSEQAQIEELQALLRATMKCAPEEGYQEWWPKLEDSLDSIMQTRSWPTVNQIRAAAKLVGKNTAEKKSAWVLDPVKIAAKAIRAGEAVGDEWIYGVRAVSLLSELSEDDLTPYRSSLFFRMKDVWGEDKARKAERQYRHKHDEARDGAGLPPIFSIPLLEESA